ncbi:hypothetical protein [Longimicrobium sp.]|uniref:hypothetical protein n=1 Tax=Longimicrobium sp. TaxID=2029185 RepID=UPI002E37CF7F|nr:hypothetical protein [Longimicrobium sp.]HEX6040139.1 hypothetical protein [Longimicrobium sp.]
MPAPLRCPTCSAPLDLPPEHASTVRCPYCGAAVLLTERAGHVEAASQQQRHSDAIGDVLRKLRAGNKIAAIQAYREHFGVGLAEARDAVGRLEAGQPGGSIPGASPGARRGVLAAIVVLALVAILGVRALRDTDPPVPPSLPPPPSVTTPVSPLAPKETAPETGFAREVMRFGAEGTGAGRFEDARGVAVDGAGRIYVSEYTGGRVQVFDSAGTFLTQWSADPKMPLLDLAADRGGTVYVVQSGRIHRYDGLTGRALGAFTSRGRGYRDVALALDGTLWAVADGSVVHLSKDGDILKTIDIEAAVDEDASPERVAVSGTGDLYVLDQWKADVYHLNADGRFVDRFGGGGFPPADDVAVDGRGRVYVSGMTGPIEVFNPAGEALGQVTGVAVVFGMAINDRDELFAAARNQHAIVKYRLPQGED